MYVRTENIAHFALARGAPSALPMALRVPLSFAKRIENLYYIFFRNWPVIFVFKHFSRIHYWEFSRNSFCIW